MDFKLKHVTIDKLFGYKKFDCDFGDVNILGGTNGSGKTTILKCCYYLIKEGKLPVSNLEDVVGSLQITFANGWTLYWEKVGGVQNVELKDVEGNIQVLEVLQNATKTYLAASFEQYISEAIRIYAVYGATSKSTDITYLDTLIEDQLNIRNKKFAGSMSAVLSLLQNKQEGNVIKPADFQQYMSLYMVLNKFFKDYGIGISADLTFSRGKENIPYQRLSMGEKQLLYIMLLASNASDESAILFLDEPDLGMHIGWKEQLVKALVQLAPKAQFVISTHAPSLIKGWRECVKEMSHLVQEA